MLLLLVFVLVECGVFVLMIFGCGFGYIGGMFDKLEVIFGFSM